VGLVTPTPKQPPPPPTPMRRASAKAAEEHNILVLARRWPQPQELALEVSRRMALLRQAVAGEDEAMPKLSVAKARGHGSHSARTLNGIRALFSPRRVHCVHGTGERGVRVGAHSSHSARTPTLQVLQVLPVYFVHSALTDCAGRCVL
jgi:hypothetical protein